MKILLLISMIVIPNTYASLPSNSLSIPVSNNSINKKSTVSPGLTKQEFEDAILFFEVFWKGPIRLQTRKELTVIGDWKLSKVDASTTSDLQDNPIIKVSGGLARHSQMNKISLLLILCHELGHHLGGAPKSLRGNTTMRSWSSAEGQADYFAVNKCMKKLMPEFENTYLTLTTKSFDTCEGDRICNQLVDASLRIATLFVSIQQDREVPSLALPSTFKVSKTVYSHPSAQCRLDTFIASLKCEKSTDFLFDDSDYRVGACIWEQNPESARPKCWFNPSFY